MPVLPPRICSCGRVVPARTRCACQRDRDHERRARFDRTRPSARQRGYDSRWEQARLDFLKRFPACRFCGEPATVVDHIKPHRGDMRLFWRRSNWQSLCTHCHSCIKQSRERRS